MTKPVTRIAIVNRGEAAARCLRAIRELRIEEGSELTGIVLYTDPDRLAPFVREADESYALGAAFQNNAAGESCSVYLDYDRIVRALQAVHADTVWPGWGFVAEHPDFAARLAQEGITFLGPSAETMRRLGDKIAAKRIAEAASVPVAAWSGGPVGRDEVVVQAKRIGFPLVLKATAGGGGRGIRVVRTSDELYAAYDSATNEAKNAFGDGTLFMEALVVRARHVEVQMAADRHGRVLAFGLRDCSVQRKHQKVVEEAPPPGLAPELVATMKTASIRLLEQVGYVGVATCEYLVADDACYFLEVNPRLQVEHGVTELLTGHDLVKTQIRIARGEHLPAVAPAERGAAIEVRLCAEDPAAGFAPSPGHIALLELPAGPGIRVDSGIAAGMGIASEFDSMVAKVLATGATREEARARLIRAVVEARAVIQGGMTNKGFLLDVLNHDAFRRGGVHTAWLDEVGLASATPPEAAALLIAAIHVYQHGRAAARKNFFLEASRGRPMNVPASNGVEVDLVYSGCPYRLRVFALSGWRYEIHDNGHSAQVMLLEQGPYTRLFVTRERRTQVLVSASDVEIRVELDGRLHRVDSDVGGRVRAPAPSLLVELTVERGDKVEAGARLGIFEAMKCETSFFAPLGGIVREVLVKPGERLAAGDVILVIEPQVDTSARNGAAARLAIPADPDPLDCFADEQQNAALENVGKLAEGAIGSVIESLRSEIKRVLLGYDPHPARTERLIRVLSSPVDALAPRFQKALAGLSHELEKFADVEVVFSRAPSIAGAEQGPSNDARMAMYLRRISAQGAGIDAGFLALLRRALAHYGIDALTPSDRLERAVLRLYSTRTTVELRYRLATALMNLMLHLSVAGEHVERRDSLREALDQLRLLRGSVTPSIVDLAAQVRFVLFDRRAAAVPPSRPGPRGPAGPTLVPPPAGFDVAGLSGALGLTPDDVERFELWRLENFALERLEVPGFAETLAFYGRSRDGSGDERLFCFTEVDDLGPGAPADPDLSAFELKFHAAVEAMRSIQSQRDPARRLHWNRMVIFVRPPIVLSDRLVGDALVRLAPETGHLGLERVLVRLACHDATDPGAKPAKLEILASNPSGGRVEWSIRDPHQRALEPASRYERRVAWARGRGLTYPYEIVRLFTAPAEPGRKGIGRPSGPGSFLEYELEDGRAVPIDREPGNNEVGVVIGMITTPTLKHPEGLRRVSILSDPTQDMGALSAGECDRIVAAIDLAEQERLPVEWVAVSSGARIAMDSGTENLDATARVVRRLVTFTDAGGEVNLILPGVNVGAQSYFDALATMGLSTRGILVMLRSASMVLTGRAALVFSGAVAAEDELGIGGYERVMGPNGEAQYYARDLPEAYAILLEHYAVSYRPPGEPTPRRFQTSDPIDRDVTRSPYEGDDGYRTIADIFSSELNPGRKRPFAMRPLMRALADSDAGHLERWRDWADAQTAIVWDCHIGGFPTTLIGIESRQLPRMGSLPNDGPGSWTAATLFAHSSKKVARALNAASGVRPAVILANLSGFDGSPESMRRGVLEWGAEIARAVVGFESKIVFAVVTRYHGGAYVVFSRELNQNMVAVALTGSYASVIGGAAAAAVVFGRDVRKRAQSDSRVRQARGALEAARDPATRAALRAELHRVTQDALLEKRAEVANEFDAIHSVERAQNVGSLDALLEPERLRPGVIAELATQLDTPIVSGG